MRPETPSVADVVQKPATPVALASMGRRAMVGMQIAGLIAQPSMARRSAGVMSRGAMSDLLSRIAKDRSNEAFRSLFETYGYKIKAYMQRQGADPASAEELAQETLLTVWRKASMYSPEKGSPSTWIFTIARNLRIDRLRRETPWQELSGAIQDTLTSDETAPDEAASERQREARVRAVLESLSPEQREVVVLAYIDGLSHSQIAERVSLPLGTVKSRMRLAYQKVRTALEDLK